MSVMVWVMVAIAPWGFTVLVPDRFWGGHHWRVLGGSGGRSRRRLPAPLAGSADGQSARRRRDDLRGDRHDRRPRLELRLRLSGGAGRRLNRAPRVPLCHTVASVARFARTTAPRGTTTIGSDALRSSCALMDGRRTVRQFARGGAGTTRSAGRTSATACARCAAGSRYAETCRRSISSPSSAASTCSRTARCMGRTGRLPERGSARTWITVRHPATADANCAATAAADAPEASYATATQSPIGSAAPGGTTITGQSACRTSASRVRSHRTRARRAGRGVAPMAMRSHGSARAVASTASAGSPLRATRTLGRVPKSAAMSSARASSACASRATWTLVASRAGGDPAGVGWAVIEATCVSVSSARTPRR